jgi:hypothetical protein
MLATGKPTYRPLPRLSEEDAFGGKRSALQHLDRHRHEIVASSISFTLLCLVFRIISPSDTPNDIFRSSNAGANWRTALAHNSVSFKASVLWFTNVTES